ncbi:single-stranded DNA-binding protein [Corynebacterium striatum]|uniref:single-stranded DNA-binding protein n=1 Tax=Corynebacterium striatum TaxID=43770 RepID=UPI00254BABC0|nr:single-stranded DNA-binding protein [Corynebacterium striatum]MDK8806815.1 single-stranded DNA-binding protein [Corynebacterium striatum]
MINFITITGGLTRDAELRFTKSGKAVTSFTLANSDNKFDQEQNQWVKTRSMYLDVTIWDETNNQNPVQWAHLAAELKKGDQVAVTGKLVTRSWETREGEKRSKVELLASSFCNQPRGQGQGQQPSQAQQQWQQAAQNGQTAQSGAWGNPAPVGQGEPPF